MTDPSPAETLAFVEAARERFLDADRRWDAGTLSGEARAEELERYHVDLEMAVPTLLALARRAIRVETVVEACWRHLEDVGDCAFCGIEEDELDPDVYWHSEKCPLVLASLITRDGKRTEQK